MFSDALFFSSVPSVEWVEFPVLLLCVWACPQPYPTPCPIKNNYQPSGIEQKMESNVDIKGLSREILRDTTGLLITALLSSNHCVVLVTQMHLHPLHPGPAFSRPLLADSLTNLLSWFTQSKRIEQQRPRVAMILKTDDPRSLSSRGNFSVVQSFQQPEPLAQYSKLCQVQGLSASQILSNTDASLPWVLEDADSRQKAAGWLHSSFLLLLCWDFPPENQPRTPQIRWRRSQRHPGLCPGKTGRPRKWK